MKCEWEWGHVYNPIKLFYIQVNFRIYGWKIDERPDNYDY